MKKINVSSFLYLPLETSENEANKILNSRFNHVNIHKIEKREHEMAVDFDVIMEKESIETAKVYFFNVLQDFDVDNYVFSEVKITHHDLKLQSQYFKDVVSGKKTFEIRKNDRSYKVGDLITFHEVDENGQYVGHVSKEYQITYITDYAQQDNYVVMSIKLA